MSIASRTDGSDRKLTVGGDGTSAAELILGRIGEIAVLPHVVFKVLELSGSADNSARELENAIIVDPAFSARMLAHANSSYYGLSRKVTSIRDAVIYLGYKAVREVAMTVGVFDMFVGKNDKESLRRRAWWRHSLDTAVACRFIADTTKKLDSSEAYTCGLLHYIGKTLLDRFGNGDYGTVENRVILGMAENDAERLEFGCDHEQLASQAARMWGLPADFVAAFQYSVKPVEDSGFAKYSACVALGTMISKMATSGVGGHELLPEWAFTELGIELRSKAEFYDAAIRRIGTHSGMQF